eukprot:570859-Pleurochrysis_carterae.AAC.1
MRAFSLLRFCESVSVSTIGRVSELIERRCLDVQMLVACVVSTYLCFSECLFAYKSVCACGEKEVEWRNGGFVRTRAECNRYRKSLSLDAIKIPVKCSIGRVGLPEGEKREQIGG